MKMPFGKFKGIELEAISHMPKGKETLKYYAGWDKIKPELKDEIEQILGSTVQVGKIEKTSASHGVETALILAKLDEICQIQKETLDKINSLAPWQE
uniref:Uncharacterized protein n=1 Tax=viral metagenome TaxID=1070528 RepID=A0A6M3LCS3_9ZZZZ